MDVRKGDNVLVLAGKDRGKRGTVERVERTKRGFGVVVPGINMAQAPPARRVANADGRHPGHPDADPHQQRAGGLPALQPADARRARAGSRASTRAARASARTAASRSRGGPSERRRDEDDSRVAASAKAAADAAKAPVTETEAATPAKAARSKNGTAAPSQGLRQRYHDDVVPALRREFGYANPMQIPRLEKVVVNIGLGEAIANAKALDAAVGDLTTITGQKPIVTRAKRSRSRSSGCATGMPIGVKVTLRGAADVRLPRPHARTRAAAHPRLPRRPHGRSTAAATTPSACASSSCSRDRLRPDRPAARPGGHDRDHGEDRRRGAQAPELLGMPFQRADSKQEGRSHDGKEVDDRQVEARPRFKIAATTTAASSAAGRAATCGVRLCRICFRERALLGELPGVTKSSW